MGQVPPVVLILLLAALRAFMWVYQAFLRRPTTPGPTGRAPFTVHLPEGDRRPARWRRLLRGLR